MDSMCFLVCRMTIGREEWIHRDNKGNYVLLSAHILTNIFVTTVVVPLTVLHFV